MGVVTERSGVGWPVRSFWSTLVCGVLAMGLLLIPGCGGGDEEAEAPPPGGPTPAAPGENTAGGATVEGGAQAETLEDSPFVLNTDQPVPPDFRAAYQRKALIVVNFLKESDDPLYPQGLGVDEQVDGNLTNLSSEYPEIEFFTYDIDNPGDAETSEELEQGQYGTLAAQMNVGFTPFIVMLAPQGDQYIVENLFQGYVDEGVLGQALFDLANIDVQGNSSDANLELDSVALTESGGGIEYFTVTNNGVRGIDLGGYSLRAMDPESGDVSDGGVQVDDALRLGSGQSASIGRVPDLTDAGGRTVRGTFGGGDEMVLESRDQVALLDSGGAVVDTIMV